MSYLAIDEIRGKTSGTPTDVNDLKYQLATAWVNFNGTGTVAIRDSYNVSSITDNGTGDYNINFSVAMDTASYTVAGMCNNNGGSSSFIDLGASISTSTTSFRVRAVTDAGAVFDSEQIALSIYGGKT